jgi:hypothetical protein
MGMQINVDPADMTQEQREAVAGFILAYPGKTGNTVVEIPAFIHKDTADQTLVEVGKQHPVDELEILHHEHESTLPNTAFGHPVVDEAAAAFGSPLTHGNACAPSPAGVAPLPPVTTAQPPASPGPASLGAPAMPGANCQMSAALQADAQKLAGMGQSGAAVLPNGVELDKQGLPWDGRIHVESKNKNADGTWRKKRSLDSALLAQVEGELRQVMGAAPAAPLAPAPSVAHIAAMPGAGAMVNVTTPPPPPTSAVGVAPVMPAAPSVAPQAGEVPADARQQFVALIGRASAAIQAQKVTQAEVTQCCTDAGVPALPLLANRLDLVTQVAYNIDALIAARG